MNLTSFVFETSQRNYRNIHCHLSEVSESAENSTLNAPTSTGHSNTEKNLNKQPTFKTRQRFEVMTPVLDVAKSVFTLNNKTSA